MLISLNIPRETLVKIDELVFQLRKANHLDSPRWPFNMPTINMDDLTPLGEQVMAQYKKDIADYEERKKTHRRTTVSRSLVIEKILRHAFGKEVL